MTFESKLAKAKLTFTESILCIFACLTIVVIFIPKSWLTQTLDIIPQHYNSVVFDDKVVNGNSIATWLDEGKQYWQCELRKKFPTPFCTYQLAVDDKDGIGLDLSKYKKMTIWGDYQGEGETIRIYLRNRHPNYYQPGNEASIKYNLIEIPIERLKTGYTFDMSDFGVADWWLMSNKIPPEYSQAEFNDVAFIEIQNGASINSGIHKFQINRMHWQKDFISNETLYQDILLAWIVLIFFILFWRMFTLKGELSQKQKHQKELQALNALLNIQNLTFDELARTDQLTQLFNRLGIRDALYTGIKKWEKQRTPFSFILVDIDLFKSINDSYGHDVGDIVLKGTADLLMQNTRRTDIIARWGGEEFLLACHDTDLYQAQRLAEILRKKLEEAQLHRDLKVTASFGVASLIKADIDHLFKSADEALYAAKAQGRNRVVASTAVE